MRRWTPNGWQDDATMPQLGTSPLFPTGADTPPTQTPDTAIGIGRNNNPFGSPGPMGGPVSGPGTAWDTNPPIPPNIGPGPGPQPMPISQPGPGLISPGSAPNPNLIGLGSTDPMLGSLNNPSASMGSLPPYRDLSSGVGPSSPTLGQDPMAKFALGLRSLMSGMGRR